jgi:deoxyribodipyrimidine photo-lyase
MGVENPHVCIFIFRRDYRLHDNTTFLEAIQWCHKNNATLLPIFIFNELQINPDKNPYFSNNHVQFLVQSLQDLQDQITAKRGKLFVYETKSSDIDVLQELSSIVDIKAIAFNKDITPFSLKRDALIESWCLDRSIECIAKEDYTLLPIDSIKNKSGKPYEVFTPFYRTCVRMKVQLPKDVPTNCMFETSTTLLGKAMIDMTKYFLHNPSLEVAGGRSRALCILESIRKGAFRFYKKQRDFPSKEATTKLSAYIKFGCVSPREVYSVAKTALGRDSLLIQQVLWREYYYNIAYHFPEVLQGQLLQQGKKNMYIRGKYEKASWNENTEDFQKWADGRTGFPIVDAAMRCLNATGWMHNRLRMIVAMFLVRHLNIDWRKGEQYFATKLVDYDAINNNQGWCWCLTYRRTLNPFKQTGKFDPQCEFIKKWVPELREVPVLDIIVWWEKVANYPNTNYPNMMIQLPGYRVKYKTYIAGYVRPKPPKDPNVKRKESKYPPGQKNVAKYSKKTENIT